MQMYIERLMQSRLEATDDASRKRGLPNEPTDGLDNAKRARLNALPPTILKIPPMAPGPASFDRLFTLTEDIGLSSFDVKQLPIDLLLKIVVPLLSQVHDSTLSQAVDVSTAMILKIYPFANMALGCPYSISDNHQRSKLATAAATESSCPR